MDSSWPKSPLKGQYRSGGSNHRNRLSLLHWNICYRYHSSKWLHCTNSAKEQLACAHLPWMWIKAISHFPTLKSMSVSGQHNSESSHKYLTKCHQSAVLVLLTLVEGVFTWNALRHNRQNEVILTKCIDYCFSEARRDGYSGVITLTFIIL